MEAEMAEHAQSTEKQLSGVVGFFADGHELIEAMKKVREQKYKHFDAFTPFPVHGLDAAQGLKRSPIPFVTLGAGLTGFICAFLLQYWTSAVDWPLNVGGKPLNSWPAFVPVMFELTVLFAGLASVGAMFLFNGLPNIKRRIFDPGITRDKFALWIGATLPIEDEDDEEAGRASLYKKFNQDEAKSLLTQAGAKEVRVVYAEGWF
jgi:hypothetical protein